MAKRQNLPAEEREIQMIGVALLASLGMSQTEIAAATAMSQSEVSRTLTLLSDSKGDRYYLNRNPSLQRKNIDADLLQLAETRYRSTDRLQEWLDSVKPKQIRRLNGLEIQAIDRKQFCREAAHHVYQVLLQSKLVGVMFGRSIRELVRAIEHLGRPERARGFGCIPLCGDPLYLANQEETEFSASAIAASLEKTVSGKANWEQPTLVGIPACIPRKFVDKRGDLVQFITSIPGYESIFGRAASALINKVDTVLTSVGVVNMSPGDKEAQTGAFLRERVEQGEAKEREIAEKAYGEIGGIVLPREGNKEFAERLNKGWVGLKRKHLEVIAKAAKPEGAPGIIVVALGKHKAEMIRAAINSSLVNEIIASRDLVDALIGGNRR